MMRVVRCVNNVPPWKLGFSKPFFLKKDHKPFTKEKKMIKYLYKVRAENAMFFVSCVMLINSAFSSDLLYSGICYLVFTLWFIASLILDEMRKFDLIGCVQVELSNLTVHKESDKPHE